MTRAQLQILIWAVRETHLFWCVQGMHFGVCIGAPQICPMGCNA